VLLLANLINCQSQQDTYQIPHPKTAVTCVDPHNKRLLNSCTSHMLCGGLALSSWLHCSQPAARNYKGEILQHNGSARAGRS
jgi:hypothetical protein